MAVKVASKDNLGDVLTKCMTGVDKARMKGIVAQLAIDVSKAFNNASKS